MEAFVRQGKGKSSKSVGPFKPILAAIHELQTPALPEGAGVRFASHAAMSSTTLADTGSIRAISTLDRT